MAGKVTYQLTRLDIPKPGRSILTSRGQQAVVGGEGQAIKISAVFGQAAQLLTAFEQPEMDGFVRGDAGQNLTIVRKGQRGQAGQGALELIHFHAGAYLPEPNKPIF